MLDIVNYRATKATEWRYGIDRQARSADCLIVMKPDITHVEHLLAALLTAFLMIMPTAGQSAQRGDTDKAVQHLMNYVSGSGLTFIRNSSSYTSTEAAEHMNKKYQHFKTDIKTAEDFITLCATKSILSGKPYLLIDKEGHEVRTSEWLKTELATYRNRPQ
jgi:hypothetical protein